MNALETKGLKVLEAKINSGVNIAAEVLLIETKIKIQLDFVKNNPDIDTQMHLNFKENIFKALMVYYNVTTDMIMKVESKTFFVLHFSPLIFGCF